MSAGGGSLAWVDAGGALHVGPESAGAEPGPAAYGKGGEAVAVTDADLFLGYLADGAELGGEVTLQRDLAEQALRRLGGGARRLDPLEAALGVVRVADAEMVRALRVISVERGSTRASSCSSPSAGRVQCAPAPWPRSWGWGRCSCPASAGC